MDVFECRRNVEVVRAGDCAGFRAGSRDGHHLQNRSDRDAVFLAMSNEREGDQGEYPDIDLTFVPETGSSTHRYAHKDGTPYPPAG